MKNRKIINILIMILTLSFVFSACEQKIPEISPDLLVLKPYTSCNSKYEVLVEGLMGLEDDMNPVNGIISLVMDMTLLYEDTPKSKILTTVYMESTQFKYTRTIESYMEEKEGSDWIYIRDNNSRYWERCLLEENSTKNIQTKLWPEEINNLLLQYSMSISDGVEESVDGIECEKKEYILDGEFYNKIQLGENMIPSAINNVLAEFGLEKIDEENIEIEIPNLDVSVWKEISTGRIFKITVELTPVIRKLFAIIINDVFEQNEMNGIIYSLLGSLVSNSMEMEITINYFNYDEVEIFIIPEEIKEGEEIEEEDLPF